MSCNSTLQFVFLNFYIMNLPSTIGIQLQTMHGIEQDPWPCVLSLPGRFDGDPASLARGNIIDRLWKAGLLLKNQGKITAVYLAIF